MASGRTVIVTVLRAFIAPQNFDLNYAYNELEHHDYEIENHQEINLLLGANYGHSFSSKPIEPFKKVTFLNQKKYLQWLQELNFNLLPNSIEGAANINRILNNQKFRQVYLEGVDSKIQRDLPNLQQRNFLFDYNYSFTHNLSRSLRLNFNAATSSIVRELDPFGGNLGTSVSKSSSRALLGGNSKSRRTKYSHIQSLVVNYKLPFQYIPLLSFIDATYNYTGNFNWIRGSEALSQVVSEDGIPLGIVNTIQNNNTKTLTGALSFAKLYSILGLKSKKIPFNAQVKKSVPNDSIAKKKYPLLKKGLTQLVDILTAIKRVQANYKENNGSVLPGYLPTVGFAGGLRPTLGLYLWESSRYSL